MSNELIRDAMAALGEWMQREGLPAFDTRAAVCDAAMRLHDSEIEVALAYWFDGRNRLICVDEVARGGETEATISTGTSPGEPPWPMPRWVSSCITTPTAATLPPAKPTRPWQIGLTSD